MYFRMFSALWIAAISLAVIFSAGAFAPIEATCGLHVCPIPVAVKANQQPNTTTMPSQVWLETRYASFDIGGKGSYVQTALTGVYDHRLFRAGALLPVVYLSGPQGDATGLGNALVFGEFFLINDNGTRLSVGSQLENPTGNHDKGLGADHFMAIPYLNFWQTVSDWRFALQVGYQQTLGSHSHGATSVLYVNPHADSEIISRAMASYTWAGKWSAELNSSLRQVTAHDAAGDKTFVDAGAALRTAIGDSLALRAGVDIPISSRSRYLFQTYIGCFYYF